MAGWGLTLLRVAVGIVFLAHGAQKLFGATAAYPHPFPWAVIAFVCGLAVFLGAWTRWAAIPLAIGMVVAIWKVHIPNGFFINWALTPGIAHGYEMNLVLIAACVCLSLAGAGELSVDKFLHRSAESALAGRHRIRSM